MTKLYLVFSGVPYEGSELIRIYSSKDTAIQYAEQYAEQYAPASYKRIDDLHWEDKWGYSLYVQEWNTYD